MAILELVSVTKSYQNGNEIENVLDKIDLSIKNFDYPEKPLKYKHIRRISD